MKLSKNIQPWTPPLSLKTDRGVHNYMSTPTIYGLIRRLVTKTKGPYLEVGSYRGQSLLAAGAGTNISCIGIDNFTGTGYRADNEAILNEQIAPHDNIRFFKEDYRYGLSLVKKIRKKFSVIFLDGPHSEEDTQEQLSLTAKLLKKGGYLIVDDYNEFGVYRAVSYFCADNPDFYIEVEEKTDQKQDPIWWNGIAVLKKS